MTAAAVVVVGALLGVGKWLVDSGEKLLKTDSSHVEVRQVVVLNGGMKTRLTGGKFVQLPSSAPQLDITVRNTGKLPALLTGVRVSIEDSARLAVCEYHSGDMIPVTGNYAVTLPILPLPEERAVVHPLHQEVPAGEVDRFKVFFRLPWNSQDNYIYALRVGLISDDVSGAIDVGRFVLGVPESVNRGGRILPEGPNPFGVSDTSEQLMGTWCAYRNLAAIDRMLSRPGRRSSSMAALSSFQSAPWWRSFADPRPPKAAVGPLLRVRLIGEGPILAVFAAEQTGNSELIERTRKRAASLLLDQAEEDLKRGSSYLSHQTILAVRQAFVFDPLARIKQLLEGTEAAVGAVEAEREAEREELEAAAVE